MRSRSIREPVKYSRLSKSLSGFEHSASRLSNMTSLTLMNANQWPFDRLKIQHGIFFAATKVTLCFIEVPSLRYFIFLLLVFASAVCAMNYSEWKKINKQAPWVTQTLVLFLSLFFLPFAILYLRPPPSFSLSYQVLYFGQIGFFSINIGTKSNLNTCAKGL